MPNVVVEIEEDAPDTEGATTTPVAVSAVSSSPNAATRMPVNLFMTNPRNGGQRLDRSASDSAPTIEHVLVWRADPQPGRPEALLPAPGFRRTRAGGRGRRWT